MALPDLDQTASGASAAQGDAWSEAMIPAYEVSRTVRHGMPIIELRGECDLNAAPEVRAAILETFAEGASSLVFDLESATFLDSSVMGAFLGARRRAAQAGGTVTILCSSPTLTRLLKLLELDRILDLRTGEEWEGAWEA